jgi:aspartyl-tRNA(Asn)/glutamyl-tRNA(Gln) amidotransferase subunit B
MPGTLPVINCRAVELTLMTGLALHCEIPPIARFARKSYFYPDLPKGYQISQHGLPLAVNGYLDIGTEAGSRRIGINNVHLEEDTGKLYHVGNVSLVDFNRAGVPLIEIVSEPDMHSAEEVRTYAEALREILVYLGINSGDMEKGVMRFEASVSVRPEGSAELLSRHEIKNLNSFRALERAVSYEIVRQIEVLESGGQVIQQTMGWDEMRGMTYVQRFKEYAEDYRYFPEPDLPPLEVSQEWVEELRNQLPELPVARRARFKADYSLGAFETNLLVAEKEVADFYEEAVAAAEEADAEAIAHWVTGEIFHQMKEENLGIYDLHLPPERLAEIVDLVATDKITGGTAKEVVAEVRHTGQSPLEIVEQKGLVQISDEDALRKVVGQVLTDHPDQVGQYLDGKGQVMGWLMGQVMRATRGKANPQMAQKLLRGMLEERRN